MMLRRLRDWATLLQTLTFRRVWNALSVLASYYVSSSLKKSWHRGYPISLSVEPTTACNLRCPECPSGLRNFSRATGTLSQDTFKDTIDQVADYTMWLNLYFQGEPYIHPQFLSLVRYAAGKKMYTMTSTNGHFLNSDTARQTVRSGLSRLIISIDGTTQDTYEAYRRGGELAKVVAGTRQVIRWKNELKSKTPYVIFQFLVVKPNEHQVPQVQALARQLGVDEVRLKTAQIYDYQNGHPLIPDNEKYARYRKLPSGTYELKYALLNQCWKMWHSAVVTWDGQVVPCCFDKDANHSMGNLQHHSFKEIWEGPDYHAFRTKILRGRNQIEICTNCTEGCRVWA